MSYESLLYELKEVSSSFRKKEGRHKLKSEGKAYCAFTIPNFCVPRTESQRCAITRIKQFELSKDVWEAAAVLDLGCNSGAMLFQASNLGTAVCKGIEFDIEKVDLARNIASYAGIDKVTFEQGDIDQLETDDLGVFDVVFALAIEGHVNQPERLFELLGRVTKRVLCFEGNGGCDIDATRQRLLTCGFTQVEYKGFCTDDIVASNNKRPVLIAWK